MELKIQGAISELHDVRQEQNLKEHVAACRELPDNTSLPFVYKDNRKSCVATPGPASMDGAGKKRAYNNRICGLKTALIVQSDIANVPLMLVHSQVSG